MAHLDFKVTIWKRLQIPDDKVEEVIEKLKAGDAETPYDLLEEDGIYFNPGGPDEECEETMTVEENGGGATQELYSSSGEILYRNNTKDITLKASDFIEWYYSDSDDTKSAGEDIIDNLKTLGYFTLTVRELLDRCAYIPEHICENVPDDFDGDLTPDEITFIDDITQEKECHKCHHKYTQDPDYCPNCGTCVN